MRRTNPTLKRIFAILVAAMLLVTSVSTVLADSHTCEGGTWYYNGDGTHTSWCKICDEVVDTAACQSLGSGCYICYEKTKPATKPEPEEPEDEPEEPEDEPECTHAWKGVSYVDEATHEVVCRDCLEPIDMESHKFVNGANCACGAIYVEEEPEQPEEPECDHEGGAWTSNNDGTHTSTCDCGENTTSGQCYDLGSGKCYMCGYEFPVEPECDHEGGAWISNNDGTHTSTCDCGKVTVDGPCYDLGSGKCYMCGYEFHECTMDELVSISDTQHQFKCECGELVGMAMNHSDPDGDGVCNCGYTMYVAPECDHEGGAWISNNDGTHTSSCDCGKVTVDGPCYDLGSGKCYMCGYEFHECTMDELVSISDTQHQFKCECGELVGVAMNHSDPDGDGVCNCGYTMYAAPECDHEGGAWISNNDGTHTSSCDCGKVTVDGPCYDLGSGKCYMCGYKFPVEEPECEHAWKGVVNKDEATHTIVCRDCLETLGVESHKYVNNMPCACGAIYVEEEEECEHEWKGVSYKDEATHTIVCRDCLETIGVESHKYVDNRPCDCGAIYVEDHKCDFAAGVTSNEDGTHNINCSCGKFVKATCLDNDGDGKCDSCGYEKYTAECEHEWKGVVNKDEGTHYIVCRDCLETLGVESHKYVNNMPCACGKIYIDHKCDFAAGVTTNNDGTHDVNCSCGVSVTVDCLDNNGDGKCDSCGYNKYETPECEHEWKGVILKDEATHTIVCRDCLKTLGVESHMFLNNMPCACGKIYIEDECEHEWKGVIDKDEASHYIVCRDCLETIGVESHKYVNNMPCACGRIYIEDTHECDYAAGVTSNGDGTHNINCECGESVEFTCLDNDGDGKCDSCGYQKYCAHGFQSIKDNGDGTHTIVCRDCPAIIVENAAHEYNEWDICACGAIKPVDEPTDEPTDAPTDEPTDEPTDAPTDEPTDEPTDAPTDEPVDEPTDEPVDEPTDEPVEDTTDETEEEADETEETDVPKTGDNRADMMMYVMAACVVMMGAALASAIAYFKPGKNRR